MIEARDFAKNGFLHVQTVFRLIEKNGLRRVENFLGNLFSRVGGHTMHEQAIFLGQGKNFRIHPIRRHFLETILFLLFASHAYPNVGVDDVRALGCLSGILRMTPSPGQTSRLAKFLDFGLRSKVNRASQVDFDSEEGTGQNP